MRACVCHLLDVSQLLLLKMTKQLLYYMLTAIFVKEEDIATYTIKAVDDPRTLNKIVYLRPPENILSLNEIVSLWEKKIGKTLEKTYLLEDQLLKKIQG